MEHFWIMKQPLNTVFCSLPRTTLKLYLQRFDRGLQFRWDFTSIALLSITSAIPHTGKYSLLFYFRPCSPRCHWVNLRLGELQCFKLSLLKFNCVQANSRWGKTVRKWGRGKITRGKNNHVYSISTTLKSCFFNGYCSCNLFIFYFAVDDTSH